MSFSTQRITLLIPASLVAVAAIGIWLGGGNTLLSQITSNPDNKKHTECSDDHQCVEMNGSGRNECNDAIRCGALQHTVCKNQQCIIQPGKGNNECITGMDCPAQNTHLACKNFACVVVPGDELESTCVNNSDCACGDSQCSSQNSVSSSSQQSLAGVSVEAQESVVSSDHSESSDITSSSFSFSSSQQSQAGIPEEETENTLAFEQQHSSVFSEVSQYSIFSEYAQSSDISFAFSSSSMQSHVAMPAQKTQQVSEMSFQSRQFVVVQSSAQSRLSLMIFTDISSQSASSEASLSSQESAVLNLAAPKQELPAICGDGLLGAPEECDDGNTKDDDGCTEFCLMEVGICGDGKLQKLLGEQCENATHTPELPYACSDCRIVSPTCADAVVDPGEECDNGTENSDAPNADCRTDCSLPICGDGIIDDQRDEVCDDGNRINNDGCSAECIAEPRKKPSAPEKPTSHVAGEFTQSIQTLTSEQKARILETVGLMVTPENIVALEQGAIPVSETQVLAAFSINTSPQFTMPQGINTIPFAQLQPRIQSRGPVGDTGPAAVAVIGSGVAAGIGWARRRRMR